MARASGADAGERPLVRGLLRAASHRPVRQPTAASGASAHKLSWPLDRTESKSVRYAPGLKCQGSPRPYISTVDRQLSLPSHLQIAPPFVYLQSSCPEPAQKQRAAGFSRTMARSTPALLTLCVKGLKNSGSHGDRSRLRKREPHRD